MNWKTDPLARQIILKALNAAAWHDVLIDPSLVPFTDDRRVQTIIDDALDALERSRPTWKDTHPSRRSWLIDRLNVLQRKIIDDPAPRDPDFFIRTAADWLAALDLPDANLLVTVADSCTRIRDLVALLKNVVSYVPPEEENQRSRDGMFYVLTDIDDLARDVQAIVGHPELTDDTFDALPNIWNAAYGKGSVALDDATEDEGETDEGETDEGETDEGETDEG